MFFTIFLAWADMWSCRCLHCKVTILDHEAACLFKIQFERTQTGAALPRTSVYVFMIHDVDRYPQFLVSRRLFSGTQFQTPCQPNVCLDSNRYIWCCEEACRSHIINFQYLALLTLQKPKWHGLALPIPFPFPSCKQDLAKTRTNWTNCQFQSLHSCGPFSIDEPEPSQWRN